MPSLTSMGMFTRTHTVKTPMHIKEFTIGTLLNLSHWDVVGVKTVSVHVYMTVHAHTSPWKPCVCMYMRVHVHT